MHFSLLKLKLFFFSALSGAPVYISNPHFYLADPDLLDAVDGLKPNQSQHETYFKIQPVSSHQTNQFSFDSFHFHSNFPHWWVNFILLFVFISISVHIVYSLSTIHFVCDSIFAQKLGVPLEGKVRVQLNLKVDQSIYIDSLKNFRSFMFPIIWVEEVGVQVFFFKYENDLKLKQNKKI